MYYAGLSEDLGAKTETVGKTWFRRIFKWKIVRDDGVIIRRFLEVHTYKDGSITLDIWLKINDKGNPTARYFLLPNQAEELRVFLNENQGASK